MEKLLARFSIEDDANFEVLRSKSLYPELIGKMAPDVQTYWLRCGCGMLAITTADLAGRDVLCDNCKRNANEPTAIGSPRPVAMRPRTERRLLFGLVAFCVLAAGVFGTRFSDAPPRAHATEIVLD